MRIAIILLSTLALFACGNDQKSTSPTPTPTDTSNSSTAGTQSAKAPTTVAAQGSDQPTEPATDSTNSAQTADSAPPQTATTKPADTMAATEGGDNAQQQMLDLARKSGCLACHAVDKKLVGPAWIDVAKRYSADPKAKTRLAEKIAKGGRGNWSDVVGNAAMPPYSPRVSDTNIAKLVDFILSLAK